MPLIFWWSVRRLRTYIDQFCNEFYASNSDHDRLKHRVEVLERQYNRQHDELALLAQHLGVHFDTVYASPEKRILKQNTKPPYMGGINPIGGDY